MTRDKAIAELVRIWHSPHLDLSLKAGLAEAIDALKGEDGDLISRRAALDAIMGEPTDAHYPSWYAQKIKLLPSAEPKIYGNEHNCVLTMFGECSYDRNGCGSCEVVDKIREAINAEPKTGAEIVPKEESDMYIAGYRDGHDDATKTGKWIQKDMCADRFCSRCNYAVWDSEAEEYNFCPNCGARMRGGDTE